MRRPFARYVARLLLAAVAVGLLNAASVRAYTPDSPEVRQSIARAATFLEKADDQRLGAKALAARVMVYLGRPEHPIVAKAVAAAKLDLDGVGVAEETRIYSLGIAVAFLAELDAERHGEELRRLIQLLLDRQKANGSWGYPGREQGDTSMTQYAVYGLWIAAQNGVTIEPNVWSRAVVWLLRTQDPGGGWGYQGTLSGGTSLVPQSEIRRSMTEAALATLYLGGERFGVWKFQRDDPSISKLLKRVEVKKPAPAPPFDVGRYRSALDGGNRWDQETKEPIFASFPCYHLYTIERYHSFRDAALGTPSNAGWYDQGTDYLLKSQRPDGSWTTPEGPVAATSFAALFLLRTTRAAIQKVDLIGAGTLVGGRGLPIGAAPAATATGTRPASIGTTSPNDDLLSLTKKLQDPAFLASISDVERRGPQADAPPPSKLKQQLIALAKGDSATAQAAALTAMGRTGDLDHVPILIEALRDADPIVHQAAVDGLRYLARRSDEFGRPLPTDEPSRLAEATRWQEWYRTIRPVGR